MSDGRTASDGVPGPAAPAPFVLLGDDTAPGCVGDDCAVPVTKVPVTNVPTTNVPTPSTPARRTPSADGPPAPTA